MKKTEESIVRSVINAIPTPKELELAAKQSIESKMFGTRLRARGAAGAAVDAIGLPELGKYAVYEMYDDICTKIRDIDVVMAQGHWHGNPSQKFSDNARFALLAHQRGLLRQKFNMAAMLFASTTRTEVIVTPPVIHVESPPLTTPKEEGEHLAFRRGENIGPVNRSMPTIAIQTDSVVVNNHEPE